ncbi:hypothetical protein LWC33_08545 [Pseudonocardia sp. RS11V-5]|uniref:hypothetical protein n=1 Tax=Pseudonocardia terrae TaxID=2905831 RepID=UPI001E2A1759|nr:hypothetical protein [Pseudonocardia terrae]MCE3551502.1 hypothetical protein [Pseudonocardia terrae]
MCGQCRAPGSREDWFAAGAPDSLGGRRRARADLARAASALLAPLGLRVEAHPGSLSLAVRTATGRTVMVSRLDQLADAARTLTGRVPDPLDPALLGTPPGTVPATVPATVPPTVPATVPPTVPATVPATVPPTVHG